MFLNVFRLHEILKNYIGIANRVDIKALLMFNQ